ncbi:MAG: asparagine synthase C-terminal domain-containing protein, partial [Firmicutes bacterium]|nr:asparagine synthase C-terminal domain-containing protein [Bacillota bacterium]
MKRVCPASSHMAKAKMPLKRYTQSGPPKDHLEATSEKLRHLFQDTVERQLVADVPVCCFLSGGLDSSAITA